MSTQDEFYLAVLNPEQPSPAGLTTWNGSDPSVRFSVYRNNVVASLVSALAETFPVTQDLVGEEFFRAMARIFVCTFPPRSRVLAFYGEALPDFIAQFSPADSVPYLADVARLEMLRVHAFYALDCAELGPTALAEAMNDIDALPELQLDLNPSVRLMHSSYAVVSLWAAHQGINDVSAVEPFSSEDALISRHKLDVIVRRIDPGTRDFIGHLLQGVSLGSASAKVTIVHPSFQLVDSLTLLIQARLISSIKIPERSTS